MCRELRSSLRTHSGRILTCFLLLSALFFGSSGDGDLRQVFQDFSEDPGWEGVNNRIVCADPPEIIQDFGWHPAAGSVQGAGEIGGTIWRSVTPAYYAMPLGPLSFMDGFSASGKLAVTAPEKEGWGFYIGFFNDERQGWRVWSSCGFRLGQAIGGWARFHLDYKTGMGKGAILNPDIVIPCDGSVHSWELVYEPGVRVEESWPDPRLPGWLDGSKNVHEDVVFERARKDDPDLTRKQLHQLLLLARDAGLVDHWYRKGSYHLWNIPDDVMAMKGRITFRFDDYDPVSYFLLPGHQEESSRINRFGVYNMQIYHGSMKFRLFDLTVNGEAVDLSGDPHWEGKNNRVAFHQTDFHARQNFGYTQTNWAGNAAGEIGGRFWGTEVIDPMHAYYADDVGSLTLDDPIGFSGWICFSEGAVDGRMLLGYFNREARIAPVRGEYKGNPPHQFMGIEVMDQTRIGYSFTAVCSPRQDIAFETRGPVFIPDRIKRPFSFLYDPDAGKAGRITVTLGEETFTEDLTQEQRRIGATFDRFGLLNPRKGGKYVDVYVDDLTYTVRRPAGYKPVYHPRIVTRLPYPEDGRKYK
jgi:hypothetical protein